LRQTAVLEKLLEHQLIDVRESILARTRLWLITDDNMAVEFKLERPATLF
jgi:hypothetical protein